MYNVNENVSANAGHNILAIYFVFMQVWFATCKAGITSSIRNAVNKLPHNLLNDLPHGIIENQEIFGESKNWVQTQQLKLRKGR